MSKENAWLQDWQLPTQYIGRRVQYHEQIDSTNTLAMSLADDASNAGMVVLAGAQTAGRGQHGRSWLASAGKSVLMSLLLYPEGELRRPAVLTAWAAVSVCLLIERLTDLRPRIKWPNDVLVPLPAEKKICGILIEQQMRRGLLAAVAGIGLNVRQEREEFDAAGLPLATSLHAASGLLLDARSVARELIVALDAEYVMLQTGDIATLETKWRQRLDLTGKLVAIECGHDTLVGTLRDVSFSRVEVDLVNGERVVLQPEIVRHVTVETARQRC